MWDICALGRLYTTGGLHGLLRDWPIFIKTCWNARSIMYPKHHGNSLTLTLVYLDFLKNIKIHHKQHKYLWLHPCHFNFQAFMIEYTNQAQNEARLCNLKITLSSMWHVVFCSACRWVNQLHTSTQQGVDLGWWGCSSNAREAHTKIFRPCPLN